MGIVERERHFARGNHVGQCVPLTITFARALESAARRLRPVNVIDKIARECCAKISVYRRAITAETEATRKKTSAWTQVSRGTLGVLRAPTRLINAYGTSKLMSE